MVGPLSELLDSADEVAPAAGANLAIERRREVQATQSGPAVSYEVVVPTAEPWRHLTEVALPRLAYFLDCRGQLLGQAPGVFVSVFVNERLYFFGVGTFLEVLGKKVGLSREAMREKWGERTGGPAASATQRLLGG